MVIEKEFIKITGPKTLYGYVKINFIHTETFNYISLVEWPTYLDGTRFEECIYRGIKDALIEYGYTVPFGSYTLENIKISENEDESVPIAYYWAAKKAVIEFLEEAGYKDGVRPYNLH